MPSRSLNDLRPEMRALAEKLMLAMDALGHPIKPICTLRTNAEQDADYAKGRTAPGQKVTYKKGGESPHNYGLAVDWLFVKEGWGGPWKLLGGEAEKLGLVWGGRWTLKDLDHTEYPKWRTVINVKAT